MNTPLESSQLTEHLEMGVVELYVNDKKLLQSFYEDLVGLDVLQSDNKEVLLGFKEREILRLIENTSLPQSERGAAGLYHSATVFESRSTLAQAIERILNNHPELYQGSADHLVSEAFYFQDPEGNGVELYFDKDPKTWQWIDGKVAMASLYIDESMYIAQHTKQSGKPHKKMGHVHLKVGSIQEAKQFYVEVLGLRITAEMPTALFVSDGKYHHNIGMNVWESNGAGPRSDALGLKSFELKLKAHEDFSRLKESLRNNETNFVESTDKILITDPWKNIVVITV